MISLLIFAVWHCHLGRAKAQSYELFSQIVGTPTQLADTSYPHGACDVMAHSYLGSDGCRNMAVGILTQDGSMGRHG